MSQDFEGSFSFLFLAFDISLVCGLFSSIQIEMAGMVNDATCNTIPFLLNGISFVVRGGGGGGGRRFLCTYSLPTVL